MSKLKIGDICKSLHHQGIVFKVVDISYSKGWQYCPPEGYTFYHIESTTVGEHGTHCAVHGPLILWRVNE